MDKDKQLELIKELKEKTSAPYMQCRCALIECDWNIDKAIKYIRNYPVLPIMDFWAYRDYKYCKQCETFYIVPKGETNCTFCGQEYLINR